MLLVGEQDLQVGRTFKRHHYLYTSSCARKDKKTSIRGHQRQLKGPQRVLLAFLTGDHEMNLWTVVPTQKKKKTKKECVDSSHSLSRRGMSNETTKGTLNEDSRLFVFFRKRKSIFNKTVISSNFYSAQGCRASLPDDILTHQPPH